jgi:hypothetical protein
MTIPFKNRTDHFLVAVINQEELGRLEDLKKTNVLITSSLEKDLAHLQDKHKAATIEIEHKKAHLMDTILANNKLLNEITTLKDTTLPQQRDVAQKSSEEQATNQEALESLKEVRFELKVVAISWGRSTSTFKILRSTDSSLGKSEAGDYNIRLAKALERGRRGRTRRNKGTVSHVFFAAIHISLIPHPDLFLRLAVLYCLSRQSPCRPTLQICSIFLCFKLTTNSRRHTSR